MPYSRLQFVVYLLILSGLVVGCLVLTGLLGLTTWPSVLLIVKLTCVIAFAGIAIGMLQQAFLGRRKGLLSNVLGIALMLFVFLLAGAPLTRAYFEHTATMSAIAKSLGLVLGIVSFGGAAEVGRHIAHRMLALRKNAR